MGMVGAAPGTTTLQLPSGQVIQITDWIDDKHYSTAEWQTGDTSALTLFSAGKSQTIAGGARASLRTDTNIPRSGDVGLPRSWEFLVYSLGIELVRATRTATGNTNPLSTDYSDPVTLATAFAINRALFCEYKYNSKTYAEGQMIDFPGGAGHFWQGSQSSREVVNNGPPDIRSRVSMVLPLHEQENIGYSFVITPEFTLTFSQSALDTNTVLTFADMRVKKSGLIKRNVS